MIRKKSLQKVCKKFARRRLCRLMQTLEKVCTGLPPDETDLIRRLPNSDADWVPGSRPECRLDQQLALGPARFAQSGTIWW